MGDFDDADLKFKAHVSWYWPGPWAFGFGFYGNATNKRFSRVHFVFNFGPLECSAGWL